MKPNAAILPFEFIVPFRDHAPVILPEVTLDPVVIFVVTKLAILVLPVIFAFVIFACTFTVR